MAKGREVADEVSQVMNISQVLPVDVMKGERVDLAYNSRLRYLIRREVMASRI